MPCKFIGILLKQIKLMNENNLAKFRNSTISPIFIIGLPRSGSTLVQKSFAILILFFVVRNLV